MGLHSGPRETRYVVFRHSFGECFARNPVGGGPGSNRSSGAAGVGEVRLGRGASCGWSGGNRHASAVAVALSRTAAFTAGDRARDAGRWDDAAAAVSPVGSCAGIVTAVYQGRIAVADGKLQEPGDDGGGQHGAAFWPETAGDS